MLKTKDSWDKLSMFEKADLIKYAVQNGIYNLNTVRQAYNEHADGGRMKSNDSVTLMQQPMQTDRMLVQWVNNLIEKKRNHDARLFALGSNMHSDDGEMTRVRRADGSYAYVKTKNGHAITGGTGKYNLYDANGKVIGTGVGDGFPYVGDIRDEGYLDEITVTPQGMQTQDNTYDADALLKAAQQAERNKEIARNRAIDAKVSQYAFTPEGFFGQALQPMNLLSPTHVGRGIYNWASGNGYGDMRDLFLPNSGVFSDEFAAEHPYLTMAGNTLTDALALGTGAALRNMTKYRAAMQAENRAAQEAVAKNWDNIISRKGIERVKVGDVEINDSNMAYRQGNDIGRTYVKYKDVDNSVAQRQIENNIALIRSKKRGTPYTSREAALDEAIRKGEYDPTAGLQIGTSSELAQETPMYADGYLWYGAPEYDKALATGDLRSGLLTAPKNDNFIIGSSTATPYKKTGSGVITEDGVTFATNNGGRLIPSDKYNLGLNVDEVGAYTWDPNYGYRKVTQEPSTIGLDDANEYVQLPYGLRTNTPLVARGTPKITAENAALITDAQWDAAQKAAWEAGDLAERQRLRDLHFIAKQSGDVLDAEGNPIHMYHGSPKRDITEFYKPGDPRLPKSKEGSLKATGEEGIYASPKKSYAQRYEADLGRTTRQEKLTLEQRRGLREGKSREEVGLPPLQPGRTYDLYSNTKQVPESSNLDFDPMSLSHEEAQAIKDAGYNGFTTTSKSGPEHVVLNPEQLKLADADTFDDAGNLIPLSQRDNFKKKDIRYVWLPWLLGGGTAATLYGNGQE